MKKKIISFTTAVIMSFSALTGGVYGSNANDTYTNVAWGKPAKASSNISELYLPSKAVDGINDNKYSTGWASGEKDEYPWLQVDLEMEYLISQVELEGRLEDDNGAYRRNFKVLVSNDADFNSYEVLGEQVNAYPYNTVCIIPSNVTARYRYVRVCKTVKEPFYIGELRVMVKSSDMKFGTNYTSKDEWKGTGESAKYAVLSDIQGTRLENIVSVLDALDIMRGYSNNTFVPQKPVTRAEYVAALMKLIGVEPAAFQGAKTPFPDVAPESAYAPYIAAARSFKIVMGSGNGAFMPDEPIYIEEAVKMLVLLSGYYEEAEAQGGYPSGYLLCGSDKGFLKGISMTGEYVSRETAAIMLYNSLSVSPENEVSYGKNTEIELGKDGNLLSIYRDIYKERGVVTAAGDYSIDSETEFLQSDKVKIDDTTYYNAYPFAGNYLGMSVEVYYSSSGTNGEKTILYVKPLSQNETITVKNEDILDSGEFSITYETADAKIKKIKLTNQTDIVYNGRALFEPLNFKTLGTGTSTFIDQDSDGIYDVVLVWKYRNFVVDSFIKTTGEIVGKYAAGLLNTRDDYRSFKIIRADNGNEVKLEELKEWDIMSVMESADTSDKNIAVAYLSNQVIMGTITSAEDENKVEIKGNFYDVDTAMGQTLKISQKGSFYMDYQGKIAAFDEMEGLKYGVLCKVSKEKGLSSDYCLKIYTKQGEFKTYRTKAGTKIDGYKIEDARFGSLDLLKTYLSLNALKADTVCQLVKYSLNDDDEIVELDTPAAGIENSSSALTLSYQNTAAAFNQVYKTFEYKYSVKDNVVVFSIPEDITDEDNFAVLGTVDLSGDNDILGYDGGDIRRFGAVIVKGDYSNKELPVNTFTMLVDSVSSVYDEDGTLKSLSGMYKGKLAKYITSPNMVDKASVIKKGDMVRLWLKNDIIVGLEHVFDIHANSNTSVLTPDNVPNYPRFKDIEHNAFMCYGTVTKKNGAYIVIDAANMSKLGLSTDYMFNIGSARVSVYNSKTSKIYPSDASEVQEGSKIFVHWYYLELRDIIIYK